MSDKYIIKEKCLDCNFVEKYWLDKETIFQYRIVDLSNVIKVDSSGIAFLVHWSKARTQDLVILNANSSTISLINLFKIASLFKYKLENNNAKI
ncbi:MAG: hypothetical protein ACI4V7_03955 [Succinivibrionaceae bacterium]